jgi:outer membrane PBP1 activator LpoA protein
MVANALTRLLTACLAAVVLSACAPSSPTTRDVSGADQAIEQAERLTLAGEHALAATAWVDVANALQIESPARADEFRLRAIEAWLRAGQADRARSLIARIDDQALPAAGRSRYQLALAEVAFMDGELEEARLRLARAAADLPIDQINRFDLLDDMIQQARSNPAREAFEALETAIYDEEFSPELALALLIDHPLASLESLARQNRHRPELAPWLDLVVTARRVLLDPPRLASDLQGWQTRHPAVGYPADAALAWLEAWRQTQPMAESIMVALPGRARMQNASQALRNGIMSAWLSMRPADRPELVFREVADEDDAIIGLWFEARELGVDYLIGPLERDQVDSLVALPDAGLPILLLNHPTEPERLQAMSGEIQAVGLIPEEEAELAAVQALVQGHRRALILAQSSDWGRRVAEAFQATFELGGGRIMDRADYAPTQPDQSALLEVLLNLDRSEQRAAELRRLMGVEIEFEPQPRTDFDLIFLAARPADARIIRPQLRFQRVGDLPVFATSAIVDGAPQAERDDDLSGITLPLPPWFIDSTPYGAERRIAERRFDQLASPVLSGLHALGADALELVRWSRRMQADPSLYLAGRTGRLRLPGNRLVERDLPFVRIVDGEVRPLQ